MLLFRKFFFFIIALAIIVLFSDPSDIFSEVSGETIIATFPRQEGRSDSYPYQLLKLALEKSGKSYKLRLSDLYYDEKRAREIIILNTGAVTIGAFGTCREFEEKLLPIRIPISRGLLGFRIFLIHKDKQPQFSRIKTLEDLKKLIAVQGPHWSDIQILENAGLSVYTTEYHTLFRLINEGRLDYFPRGANEIFDELSKYGKRYKNLAVEQDLVLIYPLALLFFMSRDNPRLHDAVYQGLLRAHKDGSFDELFRNHPAISHVFKRAHFNKRYIIKIGNPLLTEQTRNIPKEFWLDPFK